MNYERSSLKRSSRSTPKSRTARSRNRAAVASMASARRRVTAGVSRWRRSQRRFLEQAREKAERDLNDALSRKKTDDFSRRREEALRDALERRRRDLEAKRRELKSTKQEASRVEGLRRRAEAEAASLRAKADVLKRQRVDAVNKLRSETSQRLQEKTAAAHELVAMGFGQGDVASVHLHNCEQFVVSFLAVASLGGTISPSNPLYTAHELAAQQRASSATICLSSRAYEAVVDEAATLQ